MHLTHAPPGQTVLEKQNIRSCQQTAIDWTHFDVGGATGNDFA